MKGIGVMIYQFVITYCDKVYQSLVSQKASSIFVGMSKSIFNMWNTRIQLTRKHQFTYNSFTN